MSAEMKLKDRPSQTAATEEFIARSDFGVRCDHPPHRFPGDQTPKCAPIF
jgi:hypothetical protein